MEYVKKRICSVSLEVHGQVLYTVELLWVISSEVA